MRIRKVFLGTATPGGMHLLTYAARLDAVVWMASLSLLPVGVAASALRTDRRDRALDTKLEAKVLHLLVCYRRHSGICFKACVLLQSTLCHIADAAV